MERADSHQSGSDARFEREPGFALVPGGENLFLAGPGGGRVKIDELGRAIWNALPGTRDEVAAKVGLNLAVGSEIIDDFLILFVKARLIRASSIHEGESGISKRVGRAAQDAGLPSVSAVIVTRNGEAHIRACLDSLLRQDIPLLEILVVDNGSTDGTGGIIRGEYPSVRIIHPGKNLYYPGGLNYGIARAAGETVLVLNDDVELEPDVVGRLAERMRQDATAAAVVPELRLFHLRGFLNGIGNHVRGAGWGSDNFIGCVDVGQFRDLREVPSACISAALIRKSAWEAIGPFDAGYKAYYEDADWSFRARLAGWTIAAVPEAIVYHKFSAYWKNMEGKIRLVVCNRMRFLLRIFHGPSLRAFLKSYIREDLINLISLLRKGRYSLVWAYLRAYAGLVLLLPGIADARRNIRKSSVRNITVDDILALNPAFWTCMSPEGVPVLDAKTYFAYYRKILRPCL